MIRFRFILGGSLLLVGLLAVGKPVSATSGLSGSAAQSYGATSEVLPGMLVELKAPSQTTVEPLTSKDIKNMLGVVVPVNDAPIVLTSSSTSNQQVLVANAGRYNLLVSNQNGSIKANDYLSISALSGIAMKAEASQSQVIGRAVSGFDGSSGLGKVALKGSLGYTTNVSVGAVQIDVKLGPNPAHQNSQVPGFLNRIASSVANKSVSPIRIYLSVAVILAVLFITGSMFYGGVRSGIVAIGRNPLAKQAIGRGLVQTILAALIIFVAGIFAAYVILL